MIQEVSLEKKRLRREWEGVVVALRKRGEEKTNKSKLLRCEASMNN